MNAKGPVGTGPSAKRSHHQPLETLPGGGDVVRAVRCFRCGEDSGMEWGAVVLGQTGDAYTSPIGTRGAWIGVQYDCSLCSATGQVTLGKHKGQIRVGVTGR